MPVAFWTDHSIIDSDSLHLVQVSPGSDAARVSGLKAV